MLAVDCQIAKHPQSQPVHKVHQKNAVVIGDVCAHDEKHVNESIQVVAWPNSAQEGNLRKTQLRGEMKIDAPRACQVFPVGFEDAPVRLVQFIEAHHYVSCFILVWRRVVQSDDHGRLDGGDLLEERLMQLIIVAQCALAEKKDLRRVFMEPGAVEDGIQD